MCYAAYIIWTEKNPNWNIKVGKSRSTFLKDLDENLIYTEISRRKSNLIGVQREAQLSIELFHSASVPGPITWSGPRKIQCAK